MLIEKAWEIVLKAHRGQVDKGGEPYILHPIAVMMRMETVEERIVALLHDVVEDSEWESSDLRAAGFSEEVLTAVDAVTRRTDESYEQFIGRIAKNSLATRVKCADLEENMNLSRLNKQPTEKDRQRVAKYQAAYRRLKCEGQR